MHDDLTVRTIVAMWPSRSEFAADLDSQADPISVDQVDKWCQRSSIPSKYHARIIRAAKRRAFHLTAEDLVKAHDRDATLSSHRGTGEAA